MHVWIPRTATLHQSVTHVVHTVSYPIQQGHIDSHAM